jgi:hypothetical protein
MAGIETMGIQEHLPVIMHVRFNNAKRTGDCM